MVNARTTCHPWCIPVGRIHHSGLMLQYLNQGSEACERSQVCKIMHLVECFVG